jgi:hypothetical protein
LAASPISFIAAEEVFRDGSLKDAFKSAIECGCAVITLESYGKILLRRAFVVRTARETPTRYPDRVSAGCPNSMGNILNWVRNS